ncbi:hypothetical protein GOV11_01670 [Candidatus Woesearchaeota archaeon]|nr:hypothetical protein [Candidatus Woesearchaeota archaeon]
MMNSPIEPKSHGKVSAFLMNLGGMAIFLHLSLLGITYFQVNNKEQAYEKMHSYAKMDDILAYTELQCFSDGSRKIIRHRYVGDRGIYYTDLDGDGILDRLSTIENGLMADFLPVNVNREHYKVASSDFNRQLERFEVEKKCGGQQWYDL